MHQLDKARSLLQQALDVIPANKHELAEVRQYIQLAINKSESLNHNATNNASDSPTEHQKWWDTITTNLPAAKMSPQTAERVIKHLNSLMAKEQSIIDNAHKARQKPKSQQTIDHELLQD